MTDPAQRLAAEFDRLADDPQAPVSTVDFDRALADGRRTVRTRRKRFGLSGVGAFALAALIAVPMLTSGAAPQPSAAAAGTDPLSAYADFGWLPTRLTGVMYSQQPLLHSSTIIAYDPQAVAADVPSASAELFFWADADSVQAPSFTGVSQIATLNGYPVLMYTDQLPDGGASVAPSIGSEIYPCGLVFPIPKEEKPGPRGFVSVFWHTASGAAAQVNYQYMNQTGPDAAVMLHIAETVTFHRAPPPVPLPLRISGLTGVPVSFAGNGFFAGRPLYVGLEFLRRNTLLQILVDTSGAGSEMFPDCKTVSPGHEATRVINGLSVTVRVSRVSPGTPADPGTFGTAAQILDRITSLGPDPADWTTNVIVP